MLKKGKLLPSDWKKPSSGFFPCTQVSLSCINVFSFFLSRGFLLPSSFIVSHSFSIPSETFFSFSFLHRGAGEDLGKKEGCAGLFIFSEVSRRQACLCC